MAAAGKKDDKKTEDNDAAVADAAAAKQKKKKLFMFIGLAVLLVIISIGATFLVVYKVLGAKHGASEDDSSASESSAASEKSLPAIYFALKPNFTVNFDVNGRQRFLQTELTLMYREESVMKLLELHMPEVRNGLVMLLSSQVFDELQTAEGKEKLRAQALKVVQDIIVKESLAGDAKGKSKDKEKEKDKEKAKEPANVEQVLFTQFVMQ